MPALTLNDQLLLWLAGDLTQANAILQNRPVLSSTEYALATDKVQVKAGNTKVYSYNIYNPNATVIFLQFFNAASAGAVTLGTTTATKTLAIPAGGVLDGAWDFSPLFNLGLVIAATTRPKGATLAATGVDVSLGTL